MHTDMFIYFSELPEGITRNNTYLFKMFITPPKKAITRK